MRARSGFPVLGIGASAGGVEARKSPVLAMPADLAAALVVVTHIGPDHTSVLPAILQDGGSLPVLAMEDGQVLEPGRAYVPTTNGRLIVASGRFQLRPDDAAAPREPRPIDIFLVSPARDQGEVAAGILLSCPGSDGTLGLTAIKANGGLTLAPGGSPGGKDDVPACPGMPRARSAAAWSTWCWRPARRPGSCRRWPGRMRWSRPRAGIRCRCASWR
ncbi:chemotaxis protein CheB [Dankookia sp. GCM10030260]|uniref:chemotaxis protein CheB n=1 Tax=Dankookia sp. GCM10030260 TaxID=3273390 RepID=UPI00361BC759